MELHFAEKKHEKDSLERWASSRTVETVKVYENIYFKQIHVKRRLWMQ